jgi:hypothetical protein
VLHHWHAEAEFTDSAGRPLPLPFSGEGASFSTLVKKYGGDIPAGAMRTELIRVGAINESADGNITVLGRSVTPKSDHENLISVLVHGAYALLSNIAHNSDPDREDAPMVNRFAYTQVLKSDDSGQLRRIAKDRIVEFAESIDDVFIAYESLHDSVGKDPEADAISVGVFYFEERDNTANYDW